MTVMVRFGADRARRFELQGFKRRTSKAPNLAVGQTRGARHTRATIALLDDPSILYQA